MQYFFYDFVIVVVVAEFYELDLATNRREKMLHERNKCGARVCVSL